MILKAQFRYFSLEHDRMHLSPFLLLSPGGLYWLGISHTHPPRCHGDSWQGVGQELDSAPQKKTRTTPLPKPLPQPSTLLLSTLPHLVSFPSLGLCLFLLLSVSLLWMGYCLFPNCLGQCTLQTVSWAASSPDLVRIRPSPLCESPT